MRQTYKTDKHYKALSIFGGLGHIEYVFIDKRNYQTHLTDHSFMCYHFQE